VIVPSSYSEYTLPEIVALLQENRIESRDLLRKMKLMVDKRLAKEITPEEFRADRLEAMELRGALHAHHESLRTELSFRRE
jgi:hypothetical protein